MFPWKSMKVLNFGHLSKFNLVKVEDWCSSIQILFSSKDIPSQNSNIHIMIQICIN